MRGMYGDGMVGGMCSVSGVWGGSVCCVVVVCCVVCVCGGVLYCEIVIGEVLLAVL